MLDKPHGKTRCIAMSISQRRQRDVLYSRYIGNVRNILISSSISESKSPVWANADPITVMAKSDYEQRPYIVAQISHARGSLGRTERERENRSRRVVADEVREVGFQRHYTEGEIAIFKTTGSIVASN